MSAIIGMAQNFVGSNNINLLAPNGQFGTRLQGGEDAAAPRYIFTALEPIQATILSKADDPALTWVEDDGVRVEPDYYLPVLPMLLVNGSVGIGTGFSTEVLPHSPRDLVAALRSRLSGAVADLTGVSLTPWWDGFRGTVAVDGKRVTTRGCYEFIDDEAHRVRITELPVGTWTQDYKAFLEELVSGEGAGAPKASDTSSSGRLLKSYVAASSDVEVDFTLTLDPEYYYEAKTFPADFEKRFRLVASSSTTNMVAFDCAGHLRRYASVGQMMEEFYLRRIGGYVSRKENELARLDAEIVELDARARFVKAVVNGTLVVANAEDAALLAGLKAHSLPPLSAPAEPDDLRAYEYLLRMRVDRLKAKAVLDLEGELTAVRAERAALAAKSAEDLWLADLAVFSESYERFMVARETERASVAAETAAASKKTVAKAKPKAKKVAA
jgi:DNA topoisomerase-2